MRHGPIFFCFGLFWGFFLFILDIGSKPAEITESNAKETETVLERLLESGAHEPVQPI